MGHELSTTEIAFPIDNHMVVLAKDPHDMQASQENLIAWFEEKNRASQQELADAQTNLEQAKTRKWATAGWKQQVTLARNRAQFYEKCLAALEAGYCIVPDFPTEIFAIRTTRSKPTRNKRRAEGNWLPMLQRQQSEAPAIGEGEYKSPDAIVGQNQVTHTVQGRSGESIEKTTTTVWAEGYDVPDFPMKAVKPQIMDATGKAMARKIFDEIGVLPARRPRNRPGDPIVTGRVLRREGSRVIGLTFLIAWWVDTRDL